MVRFVEFSIIIFLLLCFSSCEREFEYYTDYNKKVIVSSVLMPDSAVYVLLTYAYPPDKAHPDSIIKGISGAYVELLDDQGNRAVLQEISDYWINGFNLWYVTSPVYFTDSLKPVPGHRYTLKIFVNGYDTIRAQTTVPYSPLVDSVVCNISPDPDLNDGYHFIYDFSFFLRDTIPGRNYFYVFNSDNLAKQLTSDDPSKEFEFYGVLFSDRLFNLSFYKLNFRYFYEYSSHIPERKIYFYQVNDDFSRFLYSAIAQIPPELPNPFMEPSIVYSNVTNGYGIFCAISRPYIINISSKK